MTTINEIYPEFNTIIDVFCPICGNSAIQDKCHHLVICVEPEFFMLDEELLPEFAGFDKEGTWVGEDDDADHDFEEAIEKFLITADTTNLLALRYHLEGMACGPIGYDTLYVFDFNRAPDMLEDNEE